MGAALALAAVGVLLLCLVRGRIPFSSDQAIVALQARDIVAGGTWPAFFDAQDRNLGALESYWVAGLFAILPQTIATYRFALAILIVATVLLAWRYSTAAFGARAGCFAGLYLAAGPPFLLYKGLTSDGAYASLPLIGAAALCLAFRAARRPGGASLVGLAALAGLAFWGSYLNVVWVAPVLIVLGAGGALRRVTPGLGLLCVAAFLVTALPRLATSLMHGMGGLRPPELGAADAAGLREQLAVLLSDGLPTLLGARAVRTGQDVFPAAGLLALLVLAVVGGAGLQLARRATEPRVRAASSAFLSLIVIPPGLALCLGRTDFTEPRYLLPMLLGIAPLLAALLAGRVGPRWLALCCALAIAILHGIGHWREPEREAGLSGFTSHLQPVADALRWRGIEAVYADYWTAYALTFLGGGSLVATPFGSTNVTRRPADLDRVSRAPRPAFLLENADAARLDALLAPRGVTYERTPIAGYTLFAWLPADVVAALRSCLCVPAGPGR